MKLNLNKNQKYILACSNGPDSMALFDLLLKNNYFFIVCFVNYKTRIESDIEEENLRLICNKNNVKLETLTYNLKDKKSDFENIARKIRYDFFVKTAKKYNIKNILIAHHLDDLIETFLFQKNTNRLSEYYGLVYKRLFIDDIYLIRPLLSYPKEKIIEYCNENQIIYSTDYTNFSNIHTRNKLRNEVINNMNLLDKYKIYLSILSKNLNLSYLYKCTINLNEKYLLNKSNLNKLSIDDKYRLIYKWLKINDVKKTKNNDVDFILNNLNERNKYHINKKIITFCRDFYYIFDENVFEDTYSYSFENLKNNNIFNINFEIFGKKIKIDTTYLYVEPLINYNKIKISSYEVNLSKYLNDIHMPLILRNIWPSIVKKTENEKELIYFPRYQENYTNQNENIFNFDIKNLIKLILVDYKNNQ